MAVNVRTIDLPTAADNNDGDDDDPEYDKKDAGSRFSSSICRDQKTKLARSLIKFKNSFPSEKIWNGVAAVAS